MTTDEGDDYADVRRLLDAVPAPTVSAVDVGAVYAAALDREVRTVRRWKLAATAMAALAAAVMLAAVLPNLEVRVGDGAFVVRWGEPPAVPAPPAPLPPAATDPAVHARLAVLDERTRTLAGHEARLRELQDLILTVAADVDERDDRQRDQLAAVLRQLRAFEAATHEQMRQTEEANTALYTAVFDRTRPTGGTP